MNVYIDNIAHVGQAHPYRALFGIVLAADKERFQVGRMDQILDSELTELKSL